jgi:hypothetical protein
MDSAGALTVSHASNAASLQTARSIDGQSFDGTANITVIAPGTHAATSKTTPVDADEMPLVDSAASNVLKKLTWANLKATLKTYFDSLYQAAGSYVLQSTTVNGHALSANVTVSASDVGLGSVTNDAQTKAAVVPNTAPSAGQLLVGNAGGTAYAAQSVSGDFSLSSAGAATLTITTGTWTPVDSSGASLSLTGVSGTYMKIGKMVFITGEFTYPTTADTSTARIGGLPFSATATNFQLSPSHNGGATWASSAVVASSSTIGFSAPNTISNAVTNATLTGNVFRLAGFYLTP